MPNKKENTNSSLTFKISIITAVIVVWIVCLALILSKCDSAKNPQQTNTPTHEDEAADIITYDTSSTGTVSKADSKTVAYFDSHFTGDYYRVKEIEVSSIKDGLYYTTERFAYLTSGYVYRETYQSTYEEMDMTSSTVELLTPTNAYVIYPDMEVYFNSDGNSSLYKNTINFTNEVFTTGTINVRGIDYEYEESVASNGISVKYCFDKNGELRYTISSNDNGTITEHYVEYSNNIDPSLFEIPEHYTLEE